MDKNNPVLKVLTDLIRTGAYRVTHYHDEKHIIRMTRPLYGPKGKKRILKGGNLEIRLVIGKPNYQEREFVKRFEGKMPKNLTTFKYPPTKKK